MSEQENNTSYNGGTGYGSDSYSNYSYGNFSNSYGSYDYGNSGSGSSGSTGSTANSSETSYSDWSRQSTTGSSASGSGSGSGTSYQYSSGNYSSAGSTGSSGGNRKGKKPKAHKGGFRRFLKILFILLVILALLCGGLFLYEKITNKNPFAGIPLLERLDVTEQEEGLDADAQTQEDIADKTDDDTDALEQPTDETADAAKAEAESDTENSAEENAEGEIAGTDTQKNGDIRTTDANNTATIVLDVTQVVEDVMPAIVAIDNNYTQTVQSFYGVYSAEETASGSGIIIGETDDELLIATNHHVIDNADSLKVHFIDDTSAKADVKGSNEEMDLAVIAVDLSSLDSSTKKAIAIATLGDSEALKVGEPAIAIGNALGIGQSVTTGVISALNREIESEDGNTGTYIQTDAAINPGNSGGALLNSKGEVIGINSNKLGGTYVEGMCFAIPISNAQPVIDELMNEETKYHYASDERGYLGINAATPQGVEGAYVAAVQEGGAAELGGLLKGDIITSINDEEVSSSEDLINKLSYYQAGDTVTVSVLRKVGGSYQQTSVEVTLQSATDSGVSQQDSAQSGSSAETEDAKPSEKNN